VSAKKKSTKPNSGGSAAAGGINFQAAVTAIAMIDCAAGRQLDWLGSSRADVPARVLSETDGPGDDIAMHLATGQRIEAQMKKGLERGAHLWETLEKLANGLAADDQLIGVLVVCPLSSGTIRQNLSTDLRRMADRRADGLSDITGEFVERASKLGIDAFAISPRLFIVTLHCLDSDGASIKAAKVALSTMCAEADLAWTVLYAEASKLIERKGAHGADSVIGLLEAAGLPLRTSSHAPGVLLAAFRAWSTEQYRVVRIPGHPRPLDLNEAWIELEAMVAEPAADAFDDAIAALKTYHSSTQRSHHQRGALCATSVSRFEHPCVVVGGPGMGKSTLLRKLALDFAQEGALVLRFSAKASARRMLDGSSFVEAVLALSTDGFSKNVTLNHVRSAHRCVLLCDGLDEAMAHQALIAEGLVAMRLGFPNVVMLATTRPVGYLAPQLAGWRHYELLPIEESKVQELVLRHVALLARPEEQDSLASFALEQLGQNKTARIAARSPLILSLVAGLLAERVPLAESKAKLYGSLYSRLSRHPIRSDDGSPAEPPLLEAFIRLAGFEVTQQLAPTKGKLLSACGVSMASQLDMKPLVARALVERCWKHWEDAGVVETIAFRDEEVTTFIHKTFAEFAAAERLLELDPEPRQACVASHLANPEWREVFSFAASMGMLNPLVQALLRIGPHEALDVPRALAMSAESDEALDAGLRAELCEHAQRVIAGPLPREGLRVAESFVDFAERYPEEASAVGASLLSSEQPWTRLAGLAFSTLSPQSAERLPHPSELVDVIAQLSSLVFDRAHYMHASFDLGAFPGQQLDLLNLHAVRVALASANLADVEQVTARLVNQTFTGTTNGVYKVADLLRTKRPDLATALLKKQLHDWSLDLDDSDDYVDFFALLRPHLPEASPAPAPIASTAWQLSALLSAIDFDSRPAWESWPATIATADERVLETIKGVLAACRLDLATLSEEIASIELTAQRDKQEVWRLAYRHIESVDIRPDWNAGSLDVQQLERSLHIPVVWFSLSAARLLTSRMEPGDIPSLVERALDAGKGETLRVIAAMSTMLSPEQQLGLVIKRLQKPYVPGLHYVVEGLRPAPLPPVVDWLACSRAVLLGTKVKTATSWAKWLVQNQVDPDAGYNVFNQAFEHWKGCEEPYPEKSGTVPDSPREQLLTLMLQSRQFERACLFELVGDPRPDVREVATDGLLADVAAGVRVDAFLERIENGSYKPALLQRALRKGMALSAEQARRVRALLFSENRHLRGASLEILRLDARPPEEDADLQRLLNDEDTEIRELSRRLSLGLPFG
jgi:hypothetical protein